jgi:3-dehydroquinate synthase
MKKLIVTIQEKPQIYPIIIGEDLIETIDSLFHFSKYSKIAIISGNNMPREWLTKLQESLPFESFLILVPSGEKAKTIDTVINIWNQFQKLGLDRNSLVINLGGGVICDMGGFAASTYLRGIDFLQIPTTILAQVDASVGGKTGINFNGIKNYIGAFQQPIGVVIDVNTLSTLPERVYTQGFAEIIKHGLIADRAYFDFVSSKKPKDFNTSELTQMLAKSNEIKTKIVEEDQKERGIRKIVNFGHTIGHAIESLSFETDTPFLHGEAVLLGMLVETKISELTDLLQPEEAAIIYERLSKLGLPVSVSKIKTEDILKKIKTDKKVVKGQVNWTLLDSIGHAIINQKVDDKIVKKALATVVK